MTRSRPFLCNTAAKLAALVLLAGVVTAGTAFVAPQRAAADPSGQLSSGSELTAGQSITSPGDIYRLTMESDGDLVETIGSTAEWASGTSGSGNYAVMETGGNFQVDNAAGTSLWSTSTSDAGGAYLSLSDSGLLQVLSSGGSALWQNDEPLSWSSPTQVGSEFLAASCPAPGACAAFDDARSHTPNVRMSTGGQWSSPESLAGWPSLHEESLSCPSVTFCAAVTWDDATPYFYSDGAWAAGASTGDDNLYSISCASSSSCVAVTFDGEALTYNGTSWSSPVDIDGSNQIYSVSCATSSFCVTVGESGNALTYNGSTWSSVSVYPTSSPDLNAVSCPTVSFCTAVDVSGNAYTFNGSTWSGPAIVVSGGDFSNTLLMSVSCPTTSFCVASNREGKVFTYNGSTWSSQGIDGTTGINVVSCATASYCIAADASGDVMVGTPGYGAPLTGFAVATGAAGRHTTTCDCSEPVNTASGDFWTSATDISVPGRGPALDLARTYNSQSAATKGIFGFGWTSSYDASLVVNPDNSVTVTEPDGSQVTAEPAGSGTFTVPSWADSTLSQNTSTHVFTFVRQHTTTYSFTSSGQLTAISDLNGYTTTLSYDSAHNLSSVTDPAGRSITFTFCESASCSTGGHTYATGELETVTDPDSQNTTYTYDSYGDLTSVTDPAGRTTTYSYDTDGQHLLLQIQTRYNGAGTLTNTYDDQNRVTSQTDAAGLTTTFAYSGDNFSAAGGITTVTDPHGNREVMTYIDGEMRSLTKGAGTSDASTWYYNYDPSTFGTTATTDPDGNTTMATFDSDGNELTSTDALGKTTAWTYNTLDEPLTETDPMGIETAWSYDSDGNVLTKTVTGAGGTPTETITYTYEDSHAGDVTKIVDPVGDETDYTYDSQGDTVSTTNHPSSGVDDTTTALYDVLGRKVCEASPAATAASVSCATLGDPRTADTSTWAYDADNEVTSSTDALDHTATNSYDIAAGTAPCTSAPTGTTYCTSTTDPDDNVTVDFYDADARKIEEIVGAGTTAAATTIYGFDIAAGTSPCTGGPSSATYCTTTTDPDGNVTVDFYDSQDREVQVDQPASGMSTMTYDGAGNLLTTTTSGGTSTDAYNAYNELTSITYTSPGTGFSATPDVSYTYDDDGNRLTMTDGTGTTSYTYDALERLVSTTDGADASIGYGYDADGQVTCLAYPSATTTCPDEGTTSGTGIVTQAFNGEGNETSVTDWNSNTSTFGYDANGNLTSSSLPNGVAGTDSYNNADQVTGINWSNGSTTLAGFAYTPNADGQISSVTDSGIDTATTGYSYNSASQVTAAGSSSYSYSPTGSVTSSPQMATAGYDAAGTLCWSNTNSSATGTCSAPPTASTTYSDNAVGERTSSTDPTSAVTSYGWNQAGQMTSYTAPGGSADTYGFNGDGLRMSKTVGGVTSQFTYNSTGSVPQILSDGTYDFVYGPGGMTLEQVPVGGLSSTTSYLLTDALGSTRAITNSSGSVIDSYSYSAYGVPSTLSGTAAASPLSFDGGYTDSESGLIDLSDRYYDPITGQFLSVDPLVAQTQQPYAFGNDDPINTVDPLGLWGWNPISDATEAAGDVGHFVAKHHRVIEQIATVAAAATVLGVCAAATGGACLAVTAFSPVIGGLVGDAVYAEGGGSHTAEGYAMAFAIGGAVGAGSLAWGGVAAGAGALWAGNLAIGGAVSAFQYSKSEGCHSFGGYVRNTISGAGQNAPLNFHGTVGAGDE